MDARNVLRFVVGGIAILCWAAAPAYGQTGACCLDDGAGGACSTETQQDCANLGGIYLGDQVSCDEVQCQVQPFSMSLESGSQQISFSKFNNLNNSRRLQKVHLMLDAETMHALLLALKPQRVTCLTVADTAAHYAVTVEGQATNLSGLGQIDLPAIVRSSTFFGGPDDPRVCGDLSTPDAIALCPEHFATPPIDPSCIGASVDCPMSCDYGGPFGFAGSAPFVTSDAAQLGAFVASAGDQTFQVDIEGNGVFSVTATLINFSNEQNSAQGVATVAYEFAPLGACCLPDGTCQPQRTEQQCLDMNGTYLGDGSVCGPVGACCFDDGTCMPMPQNCCTAEGGTFLGDGSSCGPVGACCLGDDSCVELPQACCEQSGGVFVGGQCSTNVGSCCISVTECLILNETCCEARGGSFQGDGTFCGPVGACCLPNEVCVDTSKPCCEAAGGTFVGGICSPDVGACCMPDGSCVVENQRCCEAAGGTFLGQGSTCTAPGACCLPDGSCVRTTEQCCAQQGGTFVGGDCLDTVGACCLPGGNCVEVSQTCCIAQGGDFLGGACSPQSGACCLPDGTCDIMNETCCAAEGGTFKGDGAPCGPSGACCMPDGTCQVMDEACCLNQGGSFVGGECSTETGACCMPDGTCQVLSETCCVAEGGTFKGDGTVCGPAGACCLPDGTCQQLSEICCDNAGGTFLGGPCAVDDGACCLPGGTCMVMNELCCTNEGGTFIGGDCSPDAGACCLPDGTAIEVNRTCCEQQGGTFVGGPVSPNTGACCFGDGTCIEMNEVCCVTEGGVFVGGACSAKIGACCLPDGSCAVLNEACCIAEGGSFKGDGTECGDDGACCLPDGTCLPLTEICCENEGGTFVGGDCLPETGACCLPDGSAIEVNETCCEQQGGTFIGGPVSPNTGACCFDDGSCMAMNQTCCESQGGTFLGGACGNSGACCLPDGSCVNLNETCCTTQGGTFVPGETCSTESGACCLPDGTAVELNETCCTAQGGSFIGGSAGGSGACCLPDGTCMPMPEVCCNDEGGTFIGGDCGPSGACCLPGGSCMAMPEACCISEGGVFLGGDCGDVGACCLPDGSCAPLAEACCADQGGTFAGAATDCGPTGACCMPDGTCSIQPEACCLLAGGTFAGADTTCGPSGACCLPDGTCIDDQFEQCCIIQGGTFGGAASLCPTACEAPEIFAGCDDKSSLLFFSNVEIRWDSNGNLLQDTFLQLGNDYPDNVHVKMFFINGDPPLPADPDTGERPHPGWNWIDNSVTLTADQPIYWSALTGMGGDGPNNPGFSPFTALDPGFPPGRPDPQVPGERMMRGFIVAWAFDPVQQVELRWNHLFGNGTIVNYAHGWSWEYRTHGYRVVADVTHGSPTGMSPGELHLDGSEYRAPPGSLLLNFQAINSSAFSGPRMVTTDTEFTVHPLGLDLRQESLGPLTTKVDFSIWNMNETKSSTHLCATQWDQRMLSTINQFLLMTLGTDHGKARIDGVASALCDVDFDGDGLPDFVSQDAALTALTARIMRFDAGAALGAEGTNLVGLGAEPTVLQFDQTTVPLPRADQPDTTQQIQSLFNHLLEYAAVEP